MRKRISILMLCLICGFKMQSQIVGSEQTVDKQVYQGVFIVNGDKDTYYPVIFKNANQNKINHLRIYRAYNESGPNELHPTHKGGLLLEFEVNYGGWGGQLYDWKITNLRQKYNDTFANAKFVMYHKGFAVWLRGGGFKYHYESEDPANLQIALSTSALIYDHANNSYDVSAPAALSTPDIENINKYKDLKLNNIYSFNTNIGIGTTTPDAKLSVNGKIHAKEVKIDLIGWPDYVFSNSYQLPTLASVEKQIKEKGHLANIPSAKEVAKNGIELGEMNKKLLQKIEELTLYTIQQEKKITMSKKNDEKLLSIIKQQSLQLKKLEKRIQKLEK